MRPLICALLIPLSLSLQRAPAPNLFPIPENMGYEFPGVKLTPADAKLLEKAFKADLQDQDYYCGEKPALDGLPMAGLSLGKLGSGIIVKGNDPCSCGTGGCPMFVYVREKSRYRTVAKSFGWAFGVVPSKTEVPDLAFASSRGGGLMSLFLQRYDGRQFVDQACEMLTFPDGRFPDSPEDWFDPEKVSVSPCENFVPHSPADRH